MTAARPLLASEATFWFIQSFLVENLDLISLRARITDLGLEDLHEDRTALSPYVEFTVDDLLCRETAEHRATIKHPELRNVVPCGLRNYFFFGPMGLCSHILSVALGAEVASRLGPESLIHIANLFETPLERTTKVCTVTISGQDHPPDHYLSQVLSGLLARLPSGSSGPIREIQGLGSALSVTSKAVHLQRPYVATVLQYESTELYQTAFLKPFETLVRRITALAERPYATEAVWNKLLDDHDPLALGTALAAVLYRLKTASQWYKIDPSYLRGFAVTDSRGFENYHPHEDIFVTLHTRSMLVGVNRDPNASQRLFESFSSLLLATVADARAKWYASLFVNAHIDLYVAALKGKDKIDAMDILGVLFELRRHLISVVDSTTSRRRSLSSLSEIFEQFNRIFGVAELREQALQKTELVEKIYHNLQQLTLYRSAERRGANNEKLVELGS